MTLKDVEVARLDPGRFQAVLDPDACGRFLDRLELAAERLAGRRLWHVNSTEQGGGVAEMLHFLLGYLTGAGIDTRWVVIEGNPEFFQVTNASITCSMASPATEGAGRAGTSQLPPDAERDPRRAPAAGGAWRCRGPARSPDRRAGAGPGAAGQP